MARTHRIALKAALWAAALLPALRLGFAFLRHDDGVLGVNPIQYLTWATGWWTLLLLTCVLALTPLRRLSGWAWPGLIARPLGLFACFYGLLHLLTYVWLDQFWNLPAIARDVAKRPFIALGMGAFTILLLLAATSTRGWQRRLKTGWKRLHRLVYLAAALGALHFALKEKVGFREPRVLWFFAAIAILLLARLPWPVAPRSPSTT